MSECREVSDSLFELALAAGIETNGECTRFVAQHMPGESAGGNTVANVAWSLYCRLKEARNTEANRGV